MLDSLWGQEFSVAENELQSIIKKTKNPKKAKELSTEKILKSKQVSIAEKIERIKAEVYRILGNYVNDTICLKTNDELTKYFDKAIENGIIAVDTETGDDNGYGTLDTIGGNLMGLCIYTPGMKNAYVPVNHRKFITDESDQIILLEKLTDQVTEEQIGVQLKRLVDNNVKCVFHNATFDIEVLKSTCGVKLKAYWDTQVGAKILDENEIAKLKVQYQLHINPEQEKYSIEKLFQGLPYCIFEPELFALYAATDSFMTLKLYEYQLNEFEKPENADIYSLLKTVEIPIIDVIVGMELTGICVDVDYAKKMSIEYHKRSDAIQAEIDGELNKLNPIITAWRLTPEANAKKKVYPAKSSKLSEEDIIKKFPLVDEKGKHYKMSTKTPSEQLSDPIELSSVVQLQILLYDILNVPVVDKMNVRGTDADILETLAEEHHIKVCELLIKKRGVDILINTFIDKMPDLIRPRTGRLHANFNQYGAATGRFSSSDPNLQNIP